MRGDRIIPWMFAGVTIAVGFGMLVKSDLGGLIWGLPSLYVIPYMIGRIRLARVKVTDDDLWAWIDRG